MGKARILGQVKCYICGDVGANVIESKKGTLGVICKDCRTAMWLNTNLAMVKILNEMKAQKLLNKASK